MLSSAEINYDWAKFRQQQVASEAEGIRNSFGIVVAAIAFVLSAITTLGVAVVEDGVRLVTGWWPLAVILLALAGFLAVFALFVVARALSVNLGVKSIQNQIEDRFTNLPDSDAIEAEEANARAAMRAEGLGTITADDISAFVGYAPARHLDKAASEIGEIAVRMKRLRAFAIRGTACSAALLMVSLLLVLLAKSP